MVIACLLPARMLGGGRSVPSAYERSAAVRARSKSRRGATRQPIKRAERDERGERCPRSSGSHLRRRARRPTAGRGPARAVRRLTLAVAPAVAESARARPVAIDDEIAERRATGRRSLDRRALRRRGASRVVAVREHRKRNGPHANGDVRDRDRRHPTQEAPTLGHLGARARSHRRGLRRCRVAAARHAFPTAPRLRACPPATRSLRPPRPRRHSRRRRSAPRHTYRRRQHDRLLTPRRPG